MEKKQIRNFRFHVRVSKKELEQIHERMEEAGIINRSAFVRRMAIKGYVINIDLAPIKELISLQRRCANNLKQIVKHANENNIYVDEVAALQKSYEDLWEQLSDMLKYFAEIIAL